MDYGYQRLAGIPLEMEAWGMSLEQPWPTEHGEYVLVGVEPNYESELQHLVEVVDESGRPLNNVWVIFGDPGGKAPSIPLKPRENYWRGAPAVLRGKARKTNSAGVATHTLGKTGGEDIWVWDLDGYGVLRLPSPIVKGCRWINTSEYIHTGVKLTFQRRKAGVVPQADRLADLEKRIARLEQLLG